LADLALHHSEEATMNIRRNARLTCLLIGLLSTSAWVVLADVAAAGGDAWLSGTVTDDTGRPVRGAVVKASANGKTIARYTDRDGRYQIAGLEAGRYEVSINAYGFALERQTKDTADAAEPIIKLSPQNDMVRLTSADLRFLFPTTADTYVVYSTCSTCHGFETVLPMRGMTAEEWQNFLPAMTENRWGRSFFTDQDRVTQLAHGLEQLFGPDGTLGPDTRPDFSKVKHTAMSDAALGATFTEYTIPQRRTMPHSVIVDDKSGIVWFSEYDSASNKVARFNPATERFDQFPIPVPRSNAHTGAVLKDGTYLVGLDRPGADGKAAAVDRDGNLVVYEFPGKPQGSRMVVADPSREDTAWLVAGDEIWRLNTKTKHIQAFKNPVVETFPEGSYGGMIALPRRRPTSNGYASAIDSKGFLWVTQLDLGIIFKLDPETGRTASYHTPEIRSARGIAVDAQDNIWFADYYGNKLGKLDPNSGQVKLYQPPTQNSSPYGVTVDLRRNYIWFADTVGNNLTRFDPKTEEFVEYALPTRNSSIRFISTDAKGRVWYGGFWNGILGVLDPGQTEVRKAEVEATPLAPIPR
jgi:virginiamycin B lyase